MNNSAINRIKRLLFGELFFQGIVQKVEQDHMGFYRVKLLLENNKNKIVHIPIYSPEGDIRDFIEEGMSVEIGITKRGILGYYKQRIALKDKKPIILEYYTQDVNFISQGCEIMYGESPLEALSKS